MSAPSATPRVADTGKCESGGPRPSGSGWRTAREQMLVSWSYPGLLIKMQDEAESQKPGTLDDSHISVSRPAGATLRLSLEPGARAFTVHSSCAGHSYVMSVSYSILASA